MPQNLPTQINGWTLYAHECFISQYNHLITEVEALRTKYPVKYTQKNATKRLAAIQKLVFEVIPQDPTRAEYRLGKTMGENYKHWFRAKFFQQYRLFFRFHEPSKTIIYVWVNDEKSKRAYGSKSDAYKTFQKMLDSGYPPDSWADIIKQVRN